MTDDSRSLYEAALATSMDGVALVGLDGRFRDVNDALCAMTGHSREEFLRLGLVDVEAAQTPEEIAANAARIAETGKARFESRWRRKDGVVFDVEVSVAAPRGAGVLFAFVRDVTGEREGERALRRSDARYRLLAENAADIIWTADVDTLRFTFVSPAAEQLLGYRPEEVIGQSVALVLPPGVFETVPALLAGRLAVPGLPGVTNELVNRRRDGSLVPVEVRSSFALDEEGRLQIVGVTRDISERKRAEEAVQRRQAHGASLLRLAHALATARTNEEVLEAATVEIRAVLGLKDTWMYLFSDDREHAYAVAARGGVAAPVVRGESAQLEIRGHALLEEIASATDLVCVEDARTDPRTDKERVARLGLRTMINVPLLLVDRRLGAIGTGTSGDEEPRRLSDDERDYLNSLGSQVAVVLDRIRIDGEREAALEAARASEAELSLHRNHLAYLVEERSAALLLANADLKREVEARTRAEGEYRRQAEFLSLVLRSADAGTWLWDIAEDRHEWSPELRRLMGIPGDAVASGETWSSAVHPDDREKDVLELKSAIEAGAVLDHEFRVVHPDGAVRWIRTVGSAAGGPDGRATQFAGFALDTTRQKKAEEELRAARDAAEAANRAKSAFLASMSHEIRTPMNAILGFSQLLLGGSGLSPRQREQVQAIQRGGEHLLGLINDVLEMSKIEAGRATVDVAETDLWSLVLDLEEMFRLRAREKGLTLDVVRSGDLPRHVVTDERKLRQIVINLAGNAVKFTGKGGVKVRVHAAPSEEGRSLLVVDVQDTGPGIGPEELSRLFQRFEQTRTGREAGGGTGLGLAISQAFAQMLGGAISVRSRPGEGSVFTLSLPVEVVAAAETAPRVEVRRVAGLPPGETRRRILVADDVAENREVLRQMLERVGFTVATANDGAEAIERLEAWRPHLVLMDLKMPGMDGLEAIRAIRSTEEAARVPLVAVTASAFEEDRKSVEEAGGDGFVSKPFREGDLLGTIGRCLGIDFVYEGAARPGAAPEAPRAPAAAMPEALASELRAAVERADLDAILRLADEISATDAESARTVRELAEAFEYERLAAYLGRAG